MGPKKVILDVRKHNLKLKEPNAFTCIFGKRGRGKTVLAKYLVQTSEWAYESIHVVIARTEKARIFWRKIVHPTNVHAPSLELLKKLREKQNENIRKYDYLKKPFPRWLHQTLIIDDCGSLAWFMQSHEMSELASNSRQEERDVILILQHLTHAYSDIRENFDRIFVLGTNNDKIVKIMQEEFVPCTEKRVLSRTIAFLTAKEGQSCVIDNTSGARCLEEVVFYLNIPPEWDWKNEDRVGHPLLNQWADENFVEDNPCELKEEIVEDEEDEEEVIPEDDNNVFEDRFGRIVFRRLPEGMLSKSKLD